MIIVVKPEYKGSAALDGLCKAYSTTPVELAGDLLVVTSQSDKALRPEFAELAAAVHVMDSDIQLASPKFSPRRGVSAGGVAFDETGTVFIAGPCSVESEEQVESTAQFLAGLGIRIFRAGAFKPRTSPYSFQGLGSAGLEILRRTCDRHSLQLITEVRDATHVDEVIDAADIIQIGAKAMYDHGILRACGRTRKPILLKRGFGSTLQEFVQAAEFILCGGNPNVVLCERGIRTFETKTRFTLDLCGVAFLKQHTNLPVVVDPSHAMGYAYGVADLTRASMAMGVEGLLIEVHPRPSEAKSDASQQLNFEAFGELYSSTKPVAAAVGRAVR